MRPRGSGNRNQYNNTVAYDYNVEEGLEAWDSPFDFIWKMNEQLKAVKRYFTNKINAGVTETAKKALESMSAEFPSGIGIGVIGVPTSGAQTNKTMKERTETTAAYNQWKYYWKEPVGDVRSYIPGLGLRLNADSNAETNTVPGTDLNFVNKASSGTDCIGLVQRATTYRGNSYQWVDVNMRDRAENAGNTGHDVDIRARNTGYPHNNNNYASVTIIHREGIGDDNDAFTEQITEESGVMAIANFNEIREKFRRIVIGDIIRYDNAHIGIVHGINTGGIETALNVYDLMKSVRVIETTAWGLLNYACTRNMLQGDGANFTEDEAGSWHRKDESTLRNWYIERLK
ncbi:MAG: hypothetical protein LBU99_03755 [Spirochaetaceae bacterium]|nr:hypothetical protein [Spirochaetaceae bacterium]